MYYGLMEDNDKLREILKSDDRNKHIDTAINEIGGNAEDQDILRKLSGLYDGIEYTVDELVDKFSIEGSYVETLIKRFHRLAWLKLRSSRRICVYPKRVKKIRDFYE